MHIEKKMTKKYLRCRWRLALAKNINIHYYYYIIIKGSIYKKPHKCLKIKFKLGYCVRYIKWCMQLYISKANFSWSKQLINLVLSTFKFDSEKSKVYNFIFIIFLGQVTQVRTQLLFTYIQSATLTVSKLHG